MSNMLDYVAWRGDLTFTQAPFCAIDNVVFTQLVHLRLEKLPGAKEDIALGEAIEALQRDAPQKGADSLESQRYALAQALLCSARYRDVQIRFFEHNLDPASEKQFAAASFALCDGTAFIAFRGTDATLVGWKEDFNMSFESPVPSQTDAVSYLNRAAGRLPGFLRVGGHSKGGNLAIYAAAHCAPQVRVRLLKVYSDDGPGLDDATLSTVGYRALSSRIESYIPESSVIGMLMGYHDHYTVVASSGMGIFQHNPFLWQVKGPQFVTRTDVNRSSRFTNSTIHAWLNACTYEERRIFIDTLYQILRSTRAETFGDLTHHWAENAAVILAAMRQVDPGTRRILAQVLTALAAAGAANIRLLVPDKGKPPEQNDH